MSLTVFGGTEIEFNGELGAVWTLFGGTEIHCPTITQSLLQELDREEAPPPENAPFFFTLFGGTSIHFPLLTEEYLDLKRLLSSGQIDLPNFRVLWLERAGANAPRAYRTLTLFGGFERSIPSRRAEHRELDRLDRSGTLEADEVQAMRQIVELERGVALHEIQTFAESRAGLRG